MQISNGLVRVELDIPVTDLVEPGYWDRYRLRAVQSVLSPEVNQVRHAPFAVLDKND